MQLDIPVTEIAAGDQFVHDGKIYWTATDGAVVDGKLVRVVRQVRGRRQLDPRLG